MPRAEFLEHRPHLLDWLLRATDSDPQLARLGDVRTAKHRRCHKVLVSFSVFGGQFL